MKSAAAGESEVNFPLKSYEGVCNKLSKSTKEQEIGY